VLIAEGKRNNMGPIYIAEEKVIRWKGREFDWVDFYHIDENTKCLISILERYTKPMDKDKLARFTQKTMHSLTPLLLNISAEALVEAFHVTIAIQDFFEREKEKDRKLALCYLRAIRKLLSLDELFQSKDKVNLDAGSV